MKMKTYILNLYMEISMSPRSWSRNFWEIGGGVTERGIDQKKKSALVQLTAAVPLGCVGIIHIGAGRIKLNPPQVESQNTDRGS